MRSYFGPGSLVPCEKLTSQIDTSIASVLPRSVAISTRRPVGSSICHSFFTPMARIALRGGEVNHAVQPSSERGRGPPRCSGAGNKC